MVFLNGKALYEASSKQDVEDSKEREWGRIVPHVHHGKGALLHPQDSVYQWYASWDSQQTTIFANFQQFDPNHETVEITVRKYCFFPTEIARNYITIRGFEMAQASTQWAPPTATQEGLLGTHWSKGWVIEDNDIHDSRCCGISLGKGRSTGDNDSTREKRKPGYQCQLETVFLAKQRGWDKEMVGSHLVRNNTIHACGQAGIVGHLGAIFSRIEGNHIYDIAMCREFFGYEIAGIKLHAAIDVRIIHNNIHHCALGIWLDWQAQGARISRNLLFSNDRDLMIEVSHGPYIVDDNIFASAYTFDNASQGGAIVHNLMGGAIQLITTLNRSTPYHFAHSTDVAGCAVVYGGDDHVLQNLFLGGDGQYVGLFPYGTSGYDGHPASWVTYAAELSQREFGDVDVFMQVQDPVSINGNGYGGGAKPYAEECDAWCDKADMRLRILPKADGWFLQMTVPKGAFSQKTELLESDTWNPPRIVDLPYEDPDGNPVRFDDDYLGQKRPSHPKAGPLQSLQEGENCIKVWEGGTGCVHLC
jgi:hypothetical protein